MSKIWLSSDLHLGHNRQFLFGPRGFNTIEEHDEEIIKRWNEVVAETDTVYILGDIMLNDNEKGMENFRKLNGFKHIILGNHDTDARRKLYEQEENVLSVQYATVIKYNGYHFYLSHYPTITSNFDNDKPLKARIISLCGHSHYQNKFEDIDKGLIYHCELDAHNCYPVNIDTVINDIKTEVIKCKEML